MSADDRPTLRVGDYVIDREDEAESDEEPSVMLIVELTLKRADATYIDDGTTVAELTYCSMSLQIDSRVEFDDPETRHDEMHSTTTTGLTTSSCFFLPDIAVGKCVILSRSRFREQSRTNPVKLATRKQ